MRWIVFWVALLPLSAGAQPPDFTALVRGEAAAVVNIGAAYATPPVLPDVPHDESLDEFLARLAGELEREFEPPALGSGFIIGSDGYIVTNFHVVDEAWNDEVIVRLSDGRELVGRIVGMDRPTDIALVKVEAAGLPQVRIGDPKQLQVGEWVATIGSPFGLEHSMAAGIVSAIGRTIPSESHIRFIQSDVAMNPGTSGGPLFNLRGEVVGVNSLIFSNTGTSIGVSFAVPIDVAMEIVTALRKHGSVTRGRLGVRLQEVTPELARAFRLPRAGGALVTDVEKQAPAERAGIRAGDIILVFGGKPVRTHDDLLHLAAQTKPDTTVEVELVRDGKPMRMGVRVAAAGSGRTRLVDAGDTDRLGFKLVPLTEAQNRRFAPQGGLLVQRAEGAARRAGVFPGDIILAVNGRSTRSMETFRAAVEKTLPGDAVALLVLRSGSRAFIPLRIP
jgi:serine protease Do